MRNFPLAPMSPTFKVLTVLFVPMPVYFLVGAVAGGVIRGIFAAAAIFLALLWTFVWLWMRPTAFELSAHELKIVWPMRSRVVADIASARRLPVAQFRPTFGLTARFGVGGLWGTFGQLWTSRRGAVDCYVTRTDEWVLIERTAGRPLLISPQDPQAFCDAIAKGG